MANSLEVFYDGYYILTYPRKDDPDILEYEISKVEQDGDKLVLAPVMQFAVDVSLYASFTLQLISLVEGE